MSKDDKILMLCHNLERYLGLFYLSTGCWHAFLEKEYGNPLMMVTSRLQDRVEINSTSNCPRLNSIMRALIKPMPKED